MWKRWLIIPERTWGKEKESMSLPSNYVRIIDLKQESLALQVY